MDFGNKKYLSPGKAQISAEKDTHNFSIEKSHNESIKLSSAGKRQLLREPAVFG